MSKNTIGLSALLLCVPFLTLGCGDMAMDKDLEAIEQAVTGGGSSLLPADPGGDPGPPIVMGPEPTPPSDEPGSAGGGGTGWTPPADAFFCNPPSCASPCDFLSVLDLLTCVGCAGKPSVGSCASCTSAMIGAATCSNGFYQCLHQRLPDPPRETTCCTADDPPTNCQPCCYTPPGYAQQFNAACSYCQNQYD